MAKRGPGLTLEKGPLFTLKSVFANIMIATRAFGIKQINKSSHRISAFFVQNTNRNIRLGAPFKLGALGCSP
jgi:hypothetical protein